MVQRNVQRALDVPARPLKPPADVENGDRLATPGGGQLREVADRVGREPCYPAAPSADGPAMPAMRSMPILARSRWASATWPGCCRRSASAGCRGQQPAQVGHELSPYSKLSDPGRCPAANARRLRRSTTHSPGGDAPTDLRGVGHRRRDQVGGGRAGGVGRGHPGVVRRDNRQGPRAAMRRRSPRRGSSAGLTCRSSPMVEPSAPGPAGRAEAAEAVRGIDRRLAGKQPRPAAGPTRAAPRRGRRVLGAEQVGPPGRPVQQRAAGEHRDQLAGSGVLKRVGQVRERVPGGGDHPYPHRRPDRHHVAVDDRGSGRTPPGRRAFTW